MTVVCVADSRCTLGEGPCWDPRDGRLWWVDIHARRVHWFEPASRALGTIPAAVQITALGLRRAGGFVAATPAGAGVFDPASGAFTLRWPTPDEPAENRSNDGNVGADGSFWFGTMHARAARRSGAVYQVRPDWTGRRVVERWGIANTLRTSPDGQRLYLADSLDQRMFAIEITPDGLGIRHEFAGTMGQAATPDGSAIDSEGFLWNAQWDGWRVVRYAPDGRLDRVIDLPVQRPTSCTFGGPGGATLFITSARDDLTDVQLSAQPLAGGVFAVVSDVAGAAPLYFEG